MEGFKSNNQDVNEVRTFSFDSGRLPEVESSWRAANVAFPSLRCSSRPLLLPPTVAACFSDSLLQFFVQLLNNMLYCTNVTDLATQEYLISLP